MPGTPVESYTTLRARDGLMLDAQYPLPSPISGQFQLCGGLDGGLWFQNGAGNSPWVPINIAGPFDPSYWNMASFSLPPALALTATDTPTTARPVAVRMPWRRALTVDRIITHVNTAGATLTANRNYAWLCTGAGVYIPNTATADQSTNWNSTGAKVMPMTAAVQVPADPAGYIYGVMMATGTTMPVFRGQNPGAGTINVNLTAGTDPLICFRDGSTATGPRDINLFSPAPLILNMIYMAVA